jgi:hypothetical protein
MPEHAHYYLISIPLNLDTPDLENYKVTITDFASRIGLRIGRVGGTASSHGGLVNGVVLSFNLLVVKVHYTWLVSLLLWEFHVLIHCSHLYRLHAYLTMHI